jgi:hypothetical protein
MFITRRVVHYSNTPLIVDAIRSAVTHVRPIATPYDHHECVQARADDYSGIHERGDHTHDHSKHTTVKNTIRLGVYLMIQLDQMFYKIPQNNNFIITNICNYC